MIKMDDSSSAFPKVYLSSLQLWNLEEELKALQNLEESFQSDGNCIKEELDISDCEENEYIQSNDTNVNLENDSRAFLEIPNESEKDSNCVPVQNENPSSNDQIIKFFHHCLSCNETFIGLPWTSDCFCKKCEIKLTRLCAKCKQSFNTYKPLKKHVDEVCFSHCVELIHEQCSVCDRIFKNQIALKKHKRNCGVGDKFFCPHCAYSTKRKSDLTRHVIIHEGVKDYYRFVDHKSKKYTRYCEKCNETFKDILNRGVCFCPKCKSKLLCQCLKCKKNFSTQYSLYVHIKDCYSLQKVPEKCSRCLKSFNDEASLAQHAKDCREKLQFNCDHCNFKTDSRTCLTEHVNSHKISESSSNGTSQSEVEPKYLRYCPKCDVFLSPSVQCGKVCLTCNTDLIYQCVSCKKMAEYHHNIMYHVNYVCTGENKIFECTKCGQTCNTQKALDKHNIDCKKNLDYSCNKCSFIGDSQETLDLHLEYHPEVIYSGYTQRTIGYTYYCEKCNENFPQSNTITCINCNSTLQRECTKCNKRYKALASLFYHLKYICIDHTVQTETCSKCGKSIRNLFALKVHERICGVDQDYFCDHCTYKTKDRVNLISHLRRHDANENRFSKFVHYCPNCHNTYPSWTYSRKICRPCGIPLHEQCVKCKETFKDFEYLRHHINNACFATHKSSQNQEQKQIKNSKERETYLCEHCPYLTESKDDLTVHLAQHFKENLMSYYESL